LAASFKPGSSGSGTPTVALRGTATQASAVGFTTVTVNKPVGVVSGDLLVGIWWAESTSTTFTPPTGWTNVVSFTGANTRLLLSTYIAGGSEPSSYTFTQTVSGDIVGQIQAFQAGTFNAASPVSITATVVEGSSTATFVAPTVTTTSTNSLLGTVYVNQGNNSGVSVAPSGMSTIALTSTSDGEYMASYYQIIPSATATGTRTLTWVTAGTGGCYSFVVNS
jgi:hypothetical protein